MSTTCPLVLLHAIQSDDTCLYSTHLILYSSLIAQIKLNTAHARNASTARCAFFSLRSTQMSMSPVVLG